MKILIYSAVFTALSGVVLIAWYLSRPLSITPQPAAFECLRAKDGFFQEHNYKPKQIYAVGLAYANHIAETAQNFVPNADPLIFKKHLRTLTPGGGAVKFPTQEDLLQAADSMTGSLSEELRAKFPALDALLDYEVELGFVLLEDVSDADLGEKKFQPKLGFFIANDLSARSLQILGEGMPNRMEYWGMSKSLQAFLPVTGKIWVPRSGAANAIPCVRLETRVNGQIRQSEYTNVMIHTPRRILETVRKNYPDEKLSRGDLVIMGTPGGIALTAPRWKGRLADLLRFDRFTKLKFVLKGDQSKFLRGGDQVEISGEWLGKITTILK